MDDASQSIVPSPTTNEVSCEEASQLYVGRWNRLVSTTNWEKGRIISQWREALVAANVPHTEYSDDAWSRHVGGVTGQHVGRLRRVFQRFGHAYEQYTGLYWSHFQAAVDWLDAEMWLEGAVQNDWSVAQMRRTRWETLGAVAEEEPREAEVVAAELDEDVLSENDAALEASARTDHSESEVRGDEETDGSSESADTDPTSDDQFAVDSSDEQQDSVQLVRPFADLPDLPGDLTEAFEAFKLAILRHKSDHWSAILPQDVVACLDSLKELVLAPS